MSVERDVTEEHWLRDQLVHSERLSAIGELVAGVAHEINNPLQAIVGAVELMLDPRADAAVTRRDLEIVTARSGPRRAHRPQPAVVRPTQHAGSRTRTISTRSSIQTTELREYHLQQQNVRLVVDCAPEPLPVFVNREEIQQVILNLLLNAEQAIDELPAARDDRRPHERYRRPGTSSRCRTTGPGFGPDLRGRIFEPFFTTKEVGEGTGLGLSISHGIAAAHGGALEIVESEAGACFRLSLPVHHTAGPLRPRQRDGRTTVASRALVVDDEEGIRRLLVRLLERRGFEVAEARSSTRRSSRRRHCSPA